MGKFDSICGIILLLLLQTSSAIAADIITIDYRDHPTLPPILKSKLGVARSVGYNLLPQSIPFVQALGSRVFCSLISFDQLTSRPRKNFALGRTKLTSENIYVDPSANGWLHSLLHHLKREQQVIYINVVGAPPPYQQPIIKKPAAHPTPTNIPASANLIRQWLDKVITTTTPINWVVWNEPEHTLNGTNNLRAAIDMESIYRSYTKSLSNRNYFDGFGLASLMKSSLRNMSDRPSQSFLSYIIEGLKRSPATKIDYVTLNNYHGSTNALIERLNNDLMHANMDQPLVLNQFAPAIIGSDPLVAGSIQAASHYLLVLDNFVQTKEVSSACFSFWAGPDRKALLRESSGKFVQTLPFQALSLYQKMPLWRLPVVNIPANLSYNILAGHDSGGLSLLIMPRPKQDVGGINPGKSGKIERKSSRRSFRQQERQESRLVGRAEQDEQRFSSPVTVLNFKLSNMGHTTLNVRRLSGGQSDLVEEQIRTDQAGRFSIAISPLQIIMISKELQAQSFNLLPSVRSDLYIHRDAQQGWASVDAIRDGFVLALPSSDAIAHASSTYEAKEMPRTLAIQLNTPYGSHSIATSLQCTSAVLQGVFGQKNVALARWGSILAADKILSSRAFTSTPKSLPKIQKWPQPDSNGKIVISIPNTKSTITAFRLHLGAKGCKPGMQLQARVIS